MNDFSTTTNLTEVAALMSFDMGMDIKASHLKTVGNWLFLYRKDLFDEDGTKEVECFTLPCGPDTFEAYTDLPYEASPFAAKDCTNCCFSFAPLASKSALSHVS